MTDEETRPVNGALIQGEDNSLYFVPSEVLEDYKVEGGDWETAREALASDEVAGFDFRKQLPANVDIQPMRAFQGPFGKVGRYAAGLGDEPTVPDFKAINYFRG